MTAVAYKNRRLYLHGHRLHHGMVGSILAAIGAILMLHDRRDAPWTQDQ